MSIRHRMLQLIAGLIVLLGFAFGPARAQPAAAASSCYYISAYHSGHFFDVEGGSAANGARIIQWYQSYTQNQRFSIFHPDNTPSDVRVIQSASSGKVLSVNSSVAGAPVIQWSNQGAASQQWQQTSAEGLYTFRNLATGLYLDVRGYSYAAGAPLDQWYGNSGNNQLFALYETNC
jgi:hypothetical protein